MDNSDSEYEIEEAVVLVELSGIIDSNYLLQQQYPSKILGIDTDEPILQIGHCHFKGEYEDTLGTVVLYEPTNHKINDASEATEKNFKFLYKTDKKLTMKRAFLEEKSKDNIKPAEVSAVSASVQNGNSEMASAAASKIINTSKNKVKNKTKRKVVFPVIQQKKKHPISRNSIGTNTSENQGKAQTSNSEISEQSTQSESLNLQVAGNIDLIKSNASISDTAKPEHLKDSNNSSENTGKLESGNEKKKRKLSRKIRKRKHDEANANIIGSAPNLKESVDIEPVQNVGENTSIHKKKLKVQAKRSMVVDKVKASKDNLNTADHKNVSALNSTKLSSFKTDDSTYVKSTRYEEFILKDATEGRNEVKVQEESSAIDVSRMDIAESNNIEVPRIEVEKESSAIDVPRIEVEKESSAIDVLKIEVEKESNAIDIPRIEVEKESNAIDVPRIEVEKESSAIDVLRIEVEKESSAIDVPRIEVEKESNAIDVPRIEVEKESSAINVPRIEVEKESSAIDVPRIEVEKESNAIDVPRIEVAKESNAIDVPRMDIVENNTIDVPRIDVEEESSTIDVTRIEVEEESSASDASRIEVEEESSSINVPKVENEDFSVDKLEESSNEVQNLSHAGKIDSPTNLYVANQLVESSTDNISMLYLDSDANDDENCSSSGDMRQARKEDTSEIIGVCESSDGKITLLPGRELLEVIDDNGASSSYQENEKANTVEPSLATKAKGSIAEVKLIESDLEPEQVDALNMTVKQASCEVSQSEKKDTDGRVTYVLERKDSSDHEEYDTSIDAAQTYLKSISESCNPLSASDEISPPPEREATSSSKRKLSSCEVTQSITSEREFLANKDVMNECEVFENPLSDNENLVNNERVEQFETTDSGSNEVEHSRPSLNSESSASEISQSHRSVIEEAESFKGNSEEMAEENGAVCSQSTDRLHMLLSEVLVEAKDLCGSSCDIDDRSLVEEETQSNSKENDSCSYWKEKRKNVTCEVSQSDKSENSSVGKSEFTNIEIKMLSNECDESVSNLEERIDQQGGRTAYSPQEADASASTSNIQITCEVTQSSCNDKAMGDSNFPIDDKNNSNECGVYEESGSDIAIVSDDTLKDNCVSSDDVNNFSVSPSLEAEVEDEERSLSCEVSQSFRSVENRPFEEAGSSSGSRIEHLEIGVSEPRQTCEVSQSLKLDNSSPSYNLESSSNECGRTELLSDSMKSFSESPDDHSEEVCVSSDDIAAVVYNEELNIQAEEQSVSYSTCEVSQSFRCDESVVIPPVSHSVDTGIESSNECEVCASCTDSAMAVNQLDEKEKNICESSDDVNESSRDIQQDDSVESDNDAFDEACQSSKSDENVLPSNEGTGVTNENSNECSTLDNRDSSRKNATICESSEDIEVIHPTDLERNPNACSSSDKSIRESSDELVSALDNKLCDSFSSQTISGISSAESVNEIENDQISQSGNLSCLSISEMENNQISQSENAPKSSNEEVCSEIENNQISQSGGIAGPSQDSSIIESENDLISQSGGVASRSSNAFIAETENTQISQSGSSAVHFSNAVAKEAGNNQFSQAGSSTDCLNDISVNETENLISQSGSNAGSSSKVSSKETENYQISQSSSVRDLSYDVPLKETENNQISQSSSNAGSSYEVPIKETENYQISQSSSVGELSRDVLLKESENNQISQSGSNAGSSSEILSKEIENSQISQSEDDDRIYRLSQTEDVLTLDSSSFQSDAVVTSSSSDVVSSSYVDVIYSSTHASNSTVSFNSEVSQSSVRESPYVWDGNSFLTNVSTSNLRGLIPTPSDTGAHPTISVSDEPGVQSTVSLTACTGSVESGIHFEPIPNTNQEMSSSSDNNEIVESSSVSMIDESSELKESGSQTLKNISPAKVKVDKSNSEEMPCTSRSLDRTSERRKKLMESGHSKRTVSRNSSVENQSELDSNILQSPSLSRVTSRSERRSPSSSTRPSLLEVIVSSASDFRNSLLSDNNNFGKEKNNVSSVSQSSTSNVGSCNEFSESFREDFGSSLSRNNDDTAQVPQNLPFSIENSDEADSEVSGSSEGNRKYSDSSELGYSHHKVSQSSDIVNIHSSVSKTQSSLSDNISESSQRELVQSSSNVSRNSFLASSEPASVFDHVSSADENSLFVPKSSENADVSESSVNAEIVLPSCSESHSFSSDSSHQLIESSDDQFACAEDLSNFKPENTESEVSSTPSEIHHSSFDVLSMADNEQCSTVEGNVLILSGASQTHDLSDGNVTTVEVASPDSDCAPYSSNLDSEAEIAVDASNEAETLNHSSVSSPATVQLIELCDMSVPNIDASEMSIETSASTSPVNEIEIIAEVHDCEESSEVSESLEPEQNDLSQSSLADNNVSCSVSEFPESQANVNQHYSFHENNFACGSREAESKSSDDCVSSYEGVCNNMFPVQNLPSGTKELSMYSHVGEFDDSIQSSSLDETHLSINEQIKAISSPPNSSDSESNIEQTTSLSINPFVAFSSQSYILSSDQSKITSSVTTEGMNSGVHEKDPNSCSNDASEVGESSGITPTFLSKSLHMITVHEVISEPFNPEETDNVDELSLNSTLSGNICSSEQFVELPEQMVPAVQSIENENSIIIQSSNDQIDDVELDDKIVLPDDITDSNS